MNEELEQITEEQAQAAFAGGFSGTDEATEKPAEQNDGEKQAIAPEPEYVHITKQDYEFLRDGAELARKLQGQVDKSFGTAFGKLGSMEQQLREAVDKLRAIESGEQVAIDDEDIDALRNEGFAQVANAMDKLRKVRTVVVDDARVRGAIDHRLNEAVTPRMQQFAKQMLATVHPDWERVDANPKFAEWIGAQGPEFVQRLQQAAEAYDSAFIAGAMTSFKTAALQEAAKAKAAEEAKKKSDEDAQRRRQRMQAGVVPRGSGQASALSDEDQFAAGFRRYASG